MLTENKHVPASDINDWRLLPRLNDRTAGDVSPRAGRIAQQTDVRQILCIFILKKEFVKFMICN